MPSMSSIRVNQFASSITEKRETKKLKYIIHIKFLKTLAESTYLFLNASSTMQSKQQALKKIIYNVNSNKIIAPHSGSLQETNLKNPNHTPVVKGWLLASLPTGFQCILQHLVWQVHTGYFETVFQQHDAVHSVRWTLLEILILILFL